MSQVHTQIADRFKGSQSWHVGDNAACDRSDCPRALVCRRFMGKRNDFQTFADFDFNRETGDCEAYWPTIKGEKSI